MVLSKEDLKSIRNGRGYAAPGPDGPEYRPFPEGETFERRWPRYGAVKNMPCWCGSGRKLKRCHRGFPKKEEE